MSGPALVLNPQTPAVDPSNGTTISLGSDGKLQISVGGSAPVDVAPSVTGAGWLAAQRAAAAAFVSLDSEWFTDFVDVVSVSTQLNSNGTATYPNVRGGVISLNTAGGTANSQAVVFPARGALTTSPSILGAAGSDPFYAAWRCKFPAGADANTQSFCSVFKFTTDTLADCGVGIDGTFQTGGSDTNWVVSYYNGTTRTVVASAIAFDTDAYHDVVVKSDGTTVTCLIDRVVVGSFAASNIGANVPATVGASIYHAATGTLSLQIDKMFIAFNGQ